MGVSGHASSVVLPHEPVDSSSHLESNRDVTTVHWNVRQQQKQQQQQQHESCECVCIIYRVMGHCWRLVRMMEWQEYGQMMES